MLNDEMDFVASLRRELAALLGAERFELWFGDRVSFERCGHEVRVQAAEEFSLERLRKRMRHEIALACERVLGRPAELSFVLADDPPPAAATATAGVTDGAPDAAPAETSAAPFAQASPPPRATPAAPSLSPSVAPAAAPSGLWGEGAPFDAVVVGESNQAACDALLHCLRKPGMATPLVLHGPTGVGKTLLWEAAAAAARRLPGVRRALALTAEQFTSHFVEAIRGGGMPSFRSKHREVDFFLLDDVQFLIGKRNTLGEFRYTLDALVRQRKPVVLTADRPPAELTGLGSEVLARLGEGLACGLAPADLAVRRKILARLAAERGLTLTDDVLALAAERLDGDARRLRGAVNRLWAAAPQGTPLALDRAEQVLADLLPPSGRAVEMADVERAVCEVCGVSPDEMASASRAGLVSTARMLAFVLGRKYTGLPLSELGQRLNRKSHSTVVAAQQRYEQLVASGGAVRTAQGRRSLAEVVRRIESRLRLG